LRVGSSGAHCDMRIEQHRIVWLSILVRCGQLLPHTNALRRGVDVGLRDPANVGIAGRAVFGVVIGHDSLTHVRPLSTSLRTTL